MRKKYLPFFALSMVFLCTLFCGSGMALAEEGAQKTDDANVTSMEESAFLFEQPEEFYEPDITNGPWVYTSENLTIYIRQTTKYGQVHYVADLYLRNNEKAYSGFAYQASPMDKVSELPHIIARRYDAVFALTGDYLCHHANPKGVMIRDGKVYYDKKDADVLTVLPSGEMEVYEKGTITADELTEKGVADSLSFGPIFLLNGEATSECTTHFLKPANVRTAIGKISNGHYIAVVSIGKFTFTQLAQLFKDYGCEWGYNLDGGHSASMVIMGEQVNPHSMQALWTGATPVRQRPLPDLLLFGKSNLVPEVKAAVRYIGSR